jgi:hypothetical protein
MFEIMVYWMEPNPAGKWRMRCVVSEENLESNVRTAIDFVKEGRASHFSVNKLDNFENVADFELAGV